MRCSSSRSNFQTSLRRAVLLALVTVAARSAAPAVEPTRQPDAPSAWLSHVTEDIRRSEYRFHLSKDGAWSAPNRAHDLRSDIAEGGIILTSRTRGESAWKLGLCVRGFGRDGGVRKVEAPVPWSDANRVELRRYGLDEWYVNDERGLEQGFTLFSPPGEGERAAPVMIEMGIDGDLGAYPTADGREVVFKSAQGPVLRYGSLIVRDATGREIPSLLAVGTATLTIVIADEDAVYPIEVDPLMTSPSWTVEGLQANNYLGIGATTAGDVNGDGFSDVLVGAHGFDTGLLGGKAYVYLGSPSGPETFASWDADGEQAFANFGRWVAGAGDVNGDGYSDVMIGASDYDGVTSDDGAVFLWYGGPAGLGDAGTPANSDWMFFSGQSGAMAAYQAVGTPIARAGDVNGDGYDDVIIGAVNYSNPQLAEGAAWVFLGSASGLPGPTASPASASWTADSNQPGARFGWSVGCAGDVNGDGYDDVIVGALLMGKAFVWHGGPAGLGPNGTPVNADWTGTNGVASNYGVSVATAGDIDGDGYSEVIVGATLFDGPSTDDGAAYVYKGSATGLAASPMWTHVGSGGEHAGICVATAGDVNGDGFSDVIVGAETYDAFPASGAAYLWYGGPIGLGVSPDWSAFGGNANTSDSRFGFSVASAGDVNGDGYGDVIVGAYGTDSDTVTDFGAAYVFLGSPAGLATAAGSSVESDLADAQLGWSVASAGDVNGDGYSDVVVGAYRFNNGEFNEGRAFLYLGSAAGLAFIPSWTAEGNQVFANFGYSVSTAGDVNGDGYADVLVGAVNYDTGQADEGWAYVYLGSADGLAATAAWSAESDQAGVQLGWSVATAGDVNGDGFGDVIVGAPASSVGGGDAYAWYGSASGLGPHGTPANADWTAGSGVFGTQFGVSVACAGDVNGDGFSDVVVGVPNFSSGQSAEGEVLVYHGSAAGLSLVPAAAEESNQAGAHLGASVASAGDVNGDGYSDVIAGMPDYTGFFGGAMAWYGSASGLHASFDWDIFRGGSTKFGSSVASAGDVNGDGYGDVIVGARLFDNVETDEGSASIYLGSASGLSFGVAWSVEGNQNNALLGVSVAAAGDVNGDGLGDVLVGASGYTNGQSGEGAAFVFYGNGGIGGFARAPLQVRADDTAPIGPLGITDSESAFRLHALGRIAAGRGRVKLEWEVKPLGTAFNGTGLARGASLADTGFPDLVAGSAAALDEQVAGLAPATVYHWRARVVSSSPFFPRTPWFSPPFNAQNEADLRTGAAAAPFVTAVFPPDDSEGQSRGTSVVLTFSEPLDAATLVLAGSVSFLDSVGVAVPARLILSPSRRELTIDPVATLASLARFTVSITAGAKDLAGTGAIPFTSHFTTGALSGSTGTPLPNVSDETIPPPSPSNAKTGSSVAGAGDLNGDGINDFIAGSPGYQVGGNVGAGAALVYLGSASATERTSPDIIFTGAGATDRAGVSVASNFDFNGDGIPDILIGAEQVNRTAGTVGGCAPGDPCNNGKVYMIYFDPSDATHYPDLANPAVADTVSLSLVGQPGGIPGVVFTGTALGDQAGFSVSGVHGQQPSDPCVIGVPGADPAGRTDAGTVYVIFPTTPPLSGTFALDRVANGLGNQVAGIVYRGSSANDHLGFAVAATGNVTGASGDDFAFSSPYADPITDDGQQVDAGIVYVAGGGSLVPAIVEASTIGLTVNGTQILGEQAGALLGYSVAGAGLTPPNPIYPPNPIRTHVDLLMGAPRYDVTIASGLAPSVDRSNAGRVIQATETLPGGIIDVCAIGGVEPENPIKGVVWVGRATEDELGTSVAVLGDVDGDGTDDYAFGAPLTDPNGVADAGTIYLVEGAAVPSEILGTVDAGTIGNTTSGTQLVGTQAGENAGTSVAGTGDLNGGGFSDLVAGAPGKDVGADTDAGTVYEVLLDDGDGDGTLDGADCAPANALVWSLPTEVRGGTLVHAGGVTTITWLPPVVLGGKPSAILYDTIRSTSPNDLVAAAVCLETGGADTTSTDGQAPAAGQGFYYVVRAKNACGVGASGKASNGVERVTRTCP